MASARKALQAVMNEAGVTGPKMNEALVGTANDIMKRIDYHLRRLKIGNYAEHPHSRGKDNRMPGTMARSIYWQVFNATGGDEAKIKFWMESVANFVELAVQGNMVPKGAPGFNSWKVRHGGLPQAITGKDYKAIDVGRTSKGQTLKRKAKPFISGEVRVHGRMLFDRLVEHYAYIGNMVLVSAVDVRKIAMYVDAYGKSRTNRYGHDKYGQTWENDLRTVAEIAAEMETNRNNDIAALTSQGWEPGNSGKFKLEGD